LIPLSSLLYLAKFLSKMFSFAIDKQGEKEYNVNNTKKEEQENAAIERSQTEYVLFRTQRHRCAFGLL
jgi:hypothetical protein